MVILVVNWLKRLSLLLLLFPFALGNTFPLLLVQSMDSFLELLTLFVEGVHLLALVHMPYELLLFVNLPADLTEQALRFLLFKRGL
jgi:hypothetical protein